MIAYNWFDCDMPQRPLVKWAAGCVGETAVTWDDCTCCSLSFNGVETTRWATAIKNSSWAFAVIESVHLLALAVIGGAVLMRGPAAARARAAAAVRFPTSPARRGRGWS